jgi:hypothetical protein
MLEPFDLIVHHGNCYDGFASAWAARKHSPNARLLAAQYKDPAPDVAGLRVLICDFSYPRDVLIAMKEAAAELLVLDHHKTAQADLAGLDFCIFDMQRSGAGITWDTLLPDVPRPWLIQHVEDRDLWRFALYGTREIHAALSSVPFEFDAWDTFALSNRGDLIRAGAATMRFVELTAEKFAARARRMHLGRHEVWAVNVPVEFVSETGEQLKAREPHLPILGWSWDGERGDFYCSLRSRDDGPDVSAIAREFGGGGHEHAAGFRSERCPVEDSFNIDAWFSACPPGECREVELRIGSMSTERRIDRRAEGEVGRWEKLTVTPDGQVFEAFPMSIVDTHWRLLYEGKLVTETIGDAEHDLCWATPQEATEGAWAHEARSGRTHPPILMAQRALPPIGYTVIRKSDGKRIEGLTLEQCGVIVSDKLVPLRAGDKVLHEPSGKVLVLACDADGSSNLWPAGWPAGPVSPDDCTFLDRATREVRVAQLRETASTAVAVADRRDSFNAVRARLAQEQLNEVLEEPVELSETDGVEVDTTEHDAHMAGGGDARTAPGFSVRLSAPAVDDATRRKFERLRDKTGGPVFADIEPVTIEHQANTEAMAAFARLQAQADETGTTVRVSVMAEGMQIAVIEVEPIDQVIERFMASRRAPPATRQERSQAAFEQLAAPWGSGIKGADIEAWSWNPDIFAQAVEWYENRPSGGDTDGERLHSCVVIFCRTAKQHGAWAQLNQHTRQAFERAAAQLQRHAL